jgi:hypothetical protein
MLPVNSRRPIVFSMVTSNVFVFAGHNVGRVLPSRHPHKPVERLHPLADVGHASDSLTQILGRLVHSWPRRCWCRQ